MLKNFFYGSAGLVMLVVALWLAFWLLLAIAHRL